VLAKSPFYQRLLGSDAASARASLSELRHLPFTTRQQLQEEQLAHPPFGSYLAVERGSIARVHKTSGTGGQALLIALTREDVEQTLDCGAACFRAAGAGPGQLIIHCLNYCLWSGGLSDHEALERSGAGVIPYGVGHSDNLIELIRAVRPTGLHCTPSYLARLEERLAGLSHGPPSALGLKLGLFGGEPGLQDPAFRERIERVWGLRAMDANYGMSEVLSMFGAECEARDGLHFLAGGVLFAEIQSGESDRTEAWEPGARGELVLTHLRRRAQPLIRYRTSDVIEVVGAGRCRCGRSEPRFRVVGRVDDMVVVRGINLYPGSIARLINGRLAQLTGEFRLLVSRCEPIHECVLKVEVRRGTCGDDLAGSLETALEKALGLRPRVHLLPEGALPRSAGKTQRVERVL
jgi:phenylacetate-CoA ligase